MPIPQDDNSMTKALMALRGLAIEATMGVAQHRALSVDDLPSLVEKTKTLLIGGANLKLTVIINCLDD